MKNHNSPSNSVSFLRYGTVYLWAWSGYSDVQFQLLPFLLTLFGHFVISVQYDLGVIAYSVPLTRRFGILDRTITSATSPCLYSKSLGCRLCGYFLCCIFPLQSVLLFPSQRRKARVVRTEYQAYLNECMSVSTVWKDIGTATRM